MRAHRRVGGLQLIEPVMLFRESQHIIQKVPELMRDGACFGNIDFSISAARRADAVHVQLPAQLCQVFRVKQERPALRAERFENRRWDAAKLQQIGVHIDAHEILQGNRNRQLGDGKRLRQKRIEKPRGFCGDIRRDNSWMQETTRL